MRSQKKLNSCMFIILGLFLCVSSIGLYSTAKAADWPIWRGAGYDGISRETGWLTKWPESGPEVLWEASIGIGFSSITISNGRAYTMGNIGGSDSVYCFDAATGKEIWKKSYPCPLFDNLHEGGPGASPTVDGDAVYTFSKKGDIIRFNAATGEIIWQKNVQDELGCTPPRWHFTSSPLVIDDLVILNAGIRGLALNKADGSVKWQNGPGTGAYSTAVPFEMDGKKCLAMLVAEEFIGLDVETGSVLWQVPWETRSGISCTDVIISGDNIFVSTGYGYGCGLFKISLGDTPVAEEIYRNKDMCTQIDSAVLWEGYVYGFDGQVARRGSLGEGILKCMELKTGEVKWSQDGMGTGTVMLADGKLIVLSEDGKLAIAEASPEGFKEMASAQILTGKCWTVPVLANGRIYARNAAGKLVCVDVSDKN